MKQTQRIPKMMSEYKIYKPHLIKQNNIQIKDLHRKSMKKEIYRLAYYKDNNPDTNITIAFFDTEKAAASWKDFLAYTVNEIQYDNMIIEKGMK